MSLKFKHIIYLIFIISNNIHSQKINLKLLSTKETDRLILQKIEYRSRHKDTISVNFEINKISSYLKNIGYFTNTIDSIIKKNDFIVYFSLNKKINTSVINIDEDELFLLDNIDNIRIEKNKVYLSIEKTKQLLEELTEKLEMKGKSFSKIRLKNIAIINSTLFADLDIHKSDKRLLNKILIKGYTDFPFSYLKNYFKINKKTVFNQKKIKEISTASKNLQFIKEIKQPEVLFTKDSTLLYLYFQKHSNNSLDGIINFSSQENGKLKFNGNIDLKFNNILNTGEKIELFWNSIGNNRQEFKILNELPFIFNTPFTSELSFSIYKQDSSFSNSKFESKIKYDISNKFKVGIHYNSETSNNLTSTNKITSFKNSFIGLNFNYRIPKNDVFNNDRINIEVNPSIGKRTTSENTINQIKIQTLASCIFDINSKSSLYLKNETGLLNYDLYLINELYRIGGPNSIRGFDQKSIFTNNYTFFNLEYRFKTSETSYLYTLTDFGKIKEENKKLISFGIGYKFIKEKSQININVSNGNIEKDAAILNNIKITINWINLF